MTFAIWKNADGTIEAVEVPSEDDEAFDDPRCIGGATATCWTQAMEMWAHAAGSAAA